MKVGDLVKNRFCGSLLVIVNVLFEENGGYYDVYALKTGERWWYVKEDLEVLS
jgi:hypothetical protein